MLSAFDFDPAYEGTLAIQPDICIAKPVPQQLLKSALQASRLPREPGAARSRPQPDRESAEIGGLPSLGLDVLVADDNAIRPSSTRAQPPRTRRRCASSTSS